MNRSTDVEMECPPLRGVKLAARRPLTRWMSIYWRTRRQISSVACSSHGVERGCSFSQYRVNVAARRPAISGLPSTLDLLSTGTGYRTDRRLDGTCVHTPSQSDALTVQSSLARRTARQGLFAPGCPFDCISHIRPQWLATECLLVLAQADYLLPAVVVSRVLQFPRGTPISTGTPFRKKKNF